MWGFQSHFRISVGLATEALLESIGAKTDAEIYLVGLRRDDGDHPFCVEPEDGYFAPEHFSDVHARGDELYDQHPRRRVLYGASHLHARIHDQLRNACRASAVRERLEEHHPGKYVFFVGPSEVVASYNVHIAIGVPRDLLEQTPSLATHEREDITIARSFLASAIDEVLNDAAIALRGPDPGSGGRIGRPAEEMARSAARRLVQSVGVLAGYPFGTPLYEVLNEVATMRYEQRVGRGRMLLVRANSANVDQQLVLRRSVRLSQTRTLRKLLELSGPKGLALLTDGEVVYGMGLARANYDPPTETMFSVTIAEQGTWELEHAGTRLLHVRYGRPMLPGQRVSREQFADIASRVFRESVELDLETLWELVQEASEAAHGTMIVVSESAAEEAERLGGQSLPVQPTHVTADQMRSLTAIDGALLFDPAGTLHALGVILDGTASLSSGDPARGARFNSAVRYLSSTPIRTMIVLVSEDGMINLLPPLRPRISRAVLTELIETLRVEAAKALAGEFDPERFNKAYGRLEEMRFYLSPTQCDEINTLRKQTEQREVDAYEIRIIREDLVANAELDDTYFVD